MSVSRNQPGSVSQTTATSDERDCLVCGHARAEHESPDRTCSGVDGRCQCHGYNPDHHPADHLHD
jgi:hypothetical protein